MSPLLILPRLWYAKQSWRLVVPGLAQICFQGLSIGGVCKSLLHRKGYLTVPAAANSSWWCRAIPSEILPRCGFLDCCSTNILTPCCRVLAHHHPSFSCRQVQHRDPSHPPLLLQWTRGYVRDFDPKCRTISEDARLLDKSSLSLASTSIEPSLIIQMESALGGAVHITREQLHSDARSLWHVAFI